MSLWGGSCTAFSKPELDYRIFKLVDLAQAHRDALEACLSRLHSDNTVSGQFHVRIKPKGLALYRGANELKALLQAYLHPLYKLMQLVVVN